MVTKVNSGVFKDQVLTGSLRAFIIKAAAATPAADMVNTTAYDTDTTGDGTDDATEYTLKDGSTAYYRLGDAVPDTLAELIYRVVSTRATVVSIEAGATDSSLHVVLENASGWGYHSVDGSNADATTKGGAVTTADIAMEGLLAELEALVGLPYSKVGSAVGAVVTGFEVDETRLCFSKTEGALGTLVDTTVKTIGGLGGNEHDQDTVSNGIPAPK